MHILFNTVTNTVKTKTAPPMLFRQLNLFWRVLPGKGPLRQVLVKHRAVHQLLSRCVMEKEQQILHLVGQSELWGDGRMMDGSAVSNPHCSARVPFP